MDIRGVPENALVADWVSRLDVVEVTERRHCRHSVDGRSDSLLKADSNEMLAIVLLNAISLMYGLAYQERFGARRSASLGVDFGIIKLKELPPRFIPLHTASATSPPIRLVY